MLRMISVLAVMTLVALCSGCAGGPSIESWRRDVEQYVKQDGNGDPAVLREVKLPDGRRGFSTIGGVHPEKSTDVNGVLVAHRVIDGRPWFIYLVGVVQNGEVRDVRVAAVSIQNTQARWLIGNGDDASLAALRKTSRGFPPEDEFACEISDRAIEVADYAANARWRLTVSPK